MFFTLLCLFVYLVFSLNFMSMEDKSLFVCRKCWHWSAYLIKLDTWYWPRMVPY